MSSIAPLVVTLGAANVTVRTAQGADGPNVLALLKATAQETDFLVRYVDEIQSTAEE